MAQEKGASETEHAGGGRMRDIAGTRYLVVVCSTIVVGAILFWVGGTLIGVVCLQLEENQKMRMVPDSRGEPMSLSLDWRLACAGCAAFASGLCLMIRAQISVFRRTGMRRSLITTRLRFVERRGGIRKKPVRYDQKH